MREEHQYLKNTHKAPQTKCENLQLPMKMESNDLVKLGIGSVTGWLGAWNSVSERGYNEDKVCGNGGI